MHKKGLVIVLVAAIIALGLGAGVAQALPPAQQGSAAGLVIPYAGRLNDEAGLPVGDAAYDLRFALYDAAVGGTLLWSEEHEGIATRDGAFTVLLGRITPLEEALLSGGPRWLEVSVRGPAAADFTTLSPRQTLRAATASTEGELNAGAPCPHDHWGESWGTSDIGVSFPGPFVALYGHSNLFAGVMGQSTSNIGVYGLSTGGEGVYGQSTNDYGVYGKSDNDDGGRFDSGSSSLYDGDIALGGSVGKIVATGAANSQMYLLAYSDVVIGLDADNNGANNSFSVRNGLDFAVCWIEENGNLTCTGTKSGAVETADYGRRKLYAVESPEVWHEDFGKAALVDGRAVVTIDPVFAQTVNLEEYHVFLTPLGECNGLYVAAKTATSFEVRELGGGRGNVSFDYRIVARRLGYEDVRLAPVVEP